MGDGQIEAFKIQSKHYNRLIARALVEMARLAARVIMIDPLLIRKDIEQTKLIPVTKTIGKHPNTDPFNLVV